MRLLVSNSFFADINPELLGWNICGMNDSDKRDVVREFATSVMVNLICLMETKVAVIDRFFLIQCLGPSFDGFAYLPVEGTRGGILFAWKTYVQNVTDGYPRYYGRSSC